MVQIVPTPIIDNPVENGTPTINQSPTREFFPGSPEHARHCHDSRLHSQSKELPIREYTLMRGSNGLGFNIKGGTDNGHLEGDSGIFVSQLKPSGAAFHDGRLKEGDKIIAVNGTDIQMMKHQEAVNVFISAGDEVCILVQPGAESYILKKLENRGGNDMMVYALAGAALLVLVGGIAAFLKLTPSTEV